MAKSSKGVARKNVNNPAGTGKDSFGGMAMGAAEANRMHDHLIAVHAGNAKAHGRGDGFSHAPGESNQSNMNRTKGKGSGNILGNSGGSLTGGSDTGC
jgi:hypothetical protein